MSQGNGPSVIGPPRVLVADQVRFFPVLHVLSDILSCSSLPVAFHISLSGHRVGWGSAGAQVVTRIAAMRWGCGITLFGSDLRAPPSHLVTHEREWISSRQSSFHLSRGASGSLARFFA